MMARMPRDTSLDATLALAFDPYEYISQRCRRYGSDVFETRLMLHKTICMKGPEAAEVFYDPDRFLRSGAAPDRLTKTLFGEGGVQGLDDEPHRHRKQMFMSLMTDDRIESLADLTDHWWRAYAIKWASKGRIVLYYEMQEVLCRAVCDWAGVPIPESDVSRRTRELTALFNQAGAFGPSHWWSRLARWKADRWLEDIIDQIRSGRLKPPEESAAHVIAWHRELDGQLLDRHAAAVELNNVLRPTVAISVFITLAALALEQHPDCLEKLQADDSGYADLFVQEVRRFYPFFPFVAARVRQDFQWKGYSFPQGRRTLLDLYGTNHDARIWEDPEEFRPERFRHWDGSPFNFIPQGGGDHDLNHRCPGEWTAIHLMKVALRFLAGGLTYEIPEQDLTLDSSRLPALPRSRFIISNVRVMT
jgi:fatty-acid peroxygenase